MATLVLMPRQGESVESCFIVKWKKKEGEKVNLNESICEVETDKSVFEVVATEEGIILKIFYGEGEDVPVLSTIALIGQPGENITSFSQGKNVINETIEENKEEKSNKIEKPEAISKEEKSIEERILISPRAKRLAEKEGLDVLKIKKGSGPGGRITVKDVQEMVQSHSQDISLTTDKINVENFPGAVREIPVRGIREIIARNMLQSLQTTAQLTLDSSAYASNFLSYRETLKNRPVETGQKKITINDIMMYITTKTLLKFKALNAHFLNDKIIEFERVHLSFAVDTPRGLIVPVVRNAHLLSLTELSKEARRLSRACLEGIIQPDELAGGTFTVTNLGSLGVESFTPILNLPQVAVLGVGSIQLKAMRENNEVKIAPHFGLSLTINHQALDGAPAAIFLKELSIAIARFEGPSGE